MGCTLVAVVWLIRYSVVGGFVRGLIAWGPSYRMRRRHRLSRMDGWTQDRLLQARVEHETELHALCGAIEAAQDSFEQLYHEYQQLFTAHQKLEQQNKLFEVPLLHS